MERNRVLRALVAVGILLGVAAQAGSSSCYGSYLGQIGENGHNAAVNGLLASQGFREAAMVSPGLAVAVLSSASQGGSGSGGYGSSYEPSEAGDWSWIFQLTERYRVIESNIAVTTLGQEGHLRAWETDANAYLVGDRWGVTISMPFRSWEGYGAYSELGAESLGLQITPQYFIMQQDSESVDLSVFFVVGYEHTWFTDDPGLDDVDYVTYGVGALIGKTFAFGDLSLGYCYQPWMNIDGDDELDGTSTMAYHSAALTYSVPLSCGVVGSLQAIWEHTGNLPDTYDSDQYLGRATLGYHTEGWSVQAGLGRTLYSDDFREWSAELSAIFRW